MQAVSVKFSVGQVVHHVGQGYRGVVVDVDPRFLGRPEWRALAGNDEAVLELPWYYVLVDGNEAATYVAERDLVADFVPTPIDHPGIGFYFTGFSDGHYLARYAPN